jgi:hypothetical protein
MRRAAVLLALTLLLAPPLRGDEPRDIVARAVQAVGGEEVVLRQNAWRLKVKAQMPQGPDIKLQGEMLVEVPARQKMSFKIELGGAGAAIEGVFVLADGKAWMSMNGQVQDVPAEAMASQEASAHAQRVQALVPLLKDRGFTLTALEDADVEGRPAAGVKASYAGQPDVHLYFDRQTHRLVKIGYRVKQVPNGPEQLVENVLSDYREVGSSAEERQLQAAGVGLDGPSLTAFLRKQAPDPNALARARELVKQLGDDDFARREKAALELVKLGAPAVPALQQAVKDEDLEVSRRAQSCLEQIQARSGLETVIAAVRLLGARRPEGAAEALLALLPGAEDVVAVEIRSALVTLAQAPGGPDPALVRALQDNDPGRRAAAAGVLGRDGGAFLARPGRRLQLPGLRFPMRLASYVDGKKQMDVEITEVQFYNRFDPREFARP